MRNPWGGTTDGVMKVKDDGRIPPMIDLRICAPGAAKNMEWDRTWEDIYLISNFKS